MRMILTLVASLFAASAFAADLRVPPQSRAPNEIPYDYFNGFYIGGHAGVGLDRGAGTASDPFGSADFNIAPFGFVGGLHAGVGTRFDRLYFGLEGDGDITTMDGTIQNPGFIGNAGSESRWLASIRGRIGLLLAPNLMAYGTGGWGWAGEKFTVTGTDGSRFSSSPTLNGGVLGAGMEYALSQNWGLRVQYLHYFLGNLKTSATGVVTDGKEAFVVPIGADVTHNIATFTAGLSYKF